MPRVKRGPKPKTRANSRQPAKAVKGSRASLASFPIPDGTSVATRAEFERLKALVETRGAADQADPGAVFDLAVARTKAVGLLAEVEADGLIVTVMGARGGSSTKAHPALPVIVSLINAMRGLRADLQISPHTAVPLEEPEEEEEPGPMAEFLGRIPFRSAQS